MKILKLFVICLGFIASSVHANVLLDSTQPDSTVGGGEGFSSPQGMVAFFYASSCPTGWLIANGQNGTPDVRGMFIRAHDAGRGVDPGRGIGSYQKDMLSQHQHYHPTHRLYRDSATSGDGPDTPRDASNTPYSGPIYPASTASDIGTEVRVKNISLLGCFKE